MRKGCVWWGEAGEVWGVDCCSLRERCREWLWGGRAGEVGGYKLQSSLLEWLLRRGRSLTQEDTSGFLGSLALLAEGQTRSSAKLTPGGGLPARGRWEETATGKEGRELRGPESRPGRGRGLSSRSQVSARRAAFRGLSDWPECLSLWGARLPLRSVLVDSKEGEETFTSLPVAGDGSWVFTQPHTIREVSKQLPSFTHSTGWSSTPCHESVAVARDACDSRLF